MTLSIFGEDEDGGVGGPNGFTAARGGSNGTAGALPAARSMSFMRSQKQTAAGLVPLLAQDRITKLGLPIGGQSQCRAPLELAKGYDPALGILHEGRD
jgi:hypothetical protein